MRTKRSQAEMLKGLYKVEMYTVHGSRRGVLYCYDDKMMGGNSAFGFVGTFRESADGEVSAEMSTIRHNNDPNFQPLLKTDHITLSLTGRRQGEQYHFEGGTPQLPGVAFNSVMTPISEEAAPPVPPFEEGGIRNGLYSIHIRMLDGIDGGNTGVMLLHNGRIRGGDGFFDYVGAYTSANGRWKGELVNHEHTPSQGERPVFGGYEVGIGFSGTYTDEGAVGEATALAGKRSIRFSAVLKKLAEA
ncbi:MAG TPA: GrlR family regulatory protein [Bradyrhizobium sp.]